MAYELLKSYKDNIENEPAYKEMAILQQELEKWGSELRTPGIPDGEVRREAKWYDHYFKGL